MNVLKSTRHISLQHNYMTKKIHADYAVDANWLENWVWLVCNEIRILVEGSSGVVSSVQDIDIDTPKSSDTRYWYWYS